MSLTDSNKQDSEYVLNDFHKVDPNTTLLYYMVPPETRIRFSKAYQTYLWIFRSLAESIPNYIRSYAETLEYKSLQQVISYDYGWTILEHLLIHHAQHLGGKVDDLQKQIYDLKIITGEELDPSINIDALQNKTLLHEQDLSPNLIFEQVLTQLM